MYKETVLDDDTEEMLDSFLKSFEEELNESTLSKGISEQNDTTDLNKLEALETTALEILKNEMNSDDPERRRKAAVDLLTILYNVKRQDNV